MKNLDVSHLVIGIQEYKLRMLRIIFLDKKEKNLDWLVDIIASQCGSKQQRAVALTIVDYVTSHAEKPKDIVTAKYIEFVQDVLDLTWQKLP